MSLETLGAALADRYRIERELGAGGMATVYLAEDLKHHRKVAIKVLRPELAAVIGAERFLREIQTIANLQHPHILGLIDSGTATVSSRESRVGSEESPGSSPRLPTPDSRLQTVVYYVMPFVEGESLRDRLAREKQLPIADAVRIATEVAAALDYAHRHGVIHRDIKPENVMLHDGSALVADFGIALAVSSAGATRMTETGMSLGTPHYMSPEQAMGEREITARSDVYALGVVTYEMLLGEPPFTGPTAQAIIAKVMTSEPVSLTSQRKTIPPAVEDAVLTALQKLPADRFANAAEFAAALGGQAVGRSTGRLPRVPAASTASAVTAALAGALLITAALAIWALRRPGGSGPAVYDAVLPDSAPIGFGVTSSNVSFGEAMRNLTISPAGDVAVYAARHGDTTALWLRSLRTGESHPIPGAVGGTSPGFSPDGTGIAYLRGDDVMLIPLRGGEPRLLLQGHSTDAINWISATQIGVGTEDGFRFNWVDVSGGGTRELRISRCPASRPIAGSALLLCSYSRSASILDPEKGTRWPLRVANSDGSFGPVIAGTGFVMVDRKYLIYFDADGALVGARFDVEKHVVSRPTRLLTGVRREVLGEGQLDIAANGTLVYAPGIDATFGRLVRLRPGGVPEPLPMPGGDFERWDLSRDGRWIAVATTGRRSSELRIYDLLNHQETVWAQDDLVRHPLWSPDGRQLMYGVLDSTRWRVRRGQPGSSAEPITLIDTDYGSQPPFDPVDWHDDHLAIAQDLAKSTISRFDPSAEKPVAQVLVAGGTFGSMSPNGKLLSYQTSEVNRIMVTGIAPGSRQWQASSNGVEPLWLSGTELLFRLGFSWYKVNLNPETGEPKGPPAFWARDPRFSDTSGWSNRPSHDGGIIYVQGPEQHGSTYLRVIPNWVALMKAAVDSSGK